MSEPMKMDRQLAEQKLNISSGNWLYGDKL